MSPSLQPRIELYRLHILTIACNMIISSHPVETVKVNGFGEDPLPLKGTQK